MVDQDDLWLMEDELPDEPTELFWAMPEIRLLADPERNDEDLGLRSILEDPEALSKAWRRSASGRRHGAPRNARHGDVLRAA